jgi:hypothetical protein
VRNKKRESDKATEYLTKFLAKAGHSDEVITKAKETVHETRDAISLQGEAVLLSIEKPARFTIKRCKECGEPFGTNYRYISHCGTVCITRALKNISGIHFDPNKSLEERFGGEVPLVIPPTAVKKLIEFATHILTQFELIDIPVRVEQGIPYRDFANAPIPRDIQNQMKLAQSPVPEPVVSSEELESADLSKDEENTTPVELPLPSNFPAISDLSLTDDLFQF